MGITRDGLHKRTRTGAKRHVTRKKRKYLMGRPPASTKIGEARVRKVRVRGGSFKYRALRLNTGNFIWTSENIAQKTRLLSVAYNPTSNELVRTNTLVKGSIIQVDALPFRAIFEARHKAMITKTRVVAKTEDGEKDTQPKQLDAQLIAQFANQKLLAKISSRPGQVGRVDGYILENQELAFYTHKIASKKKKAAKV